jgi:hypothetical protein
MPSFTPDDFDIDPGEFVDACNTRERDELINALVEDGYITESQRNKRVEGSIGKPNMQDTIFCLYMKKTISITWHTNINI